MLQEVNNNQIEYLNFININTKSALDKIRNNIDNLIQMMNITNKDIFNNAIEQCEQIENYLKERKKEIFGKYQSTSFDIGTLREPRLNLMQTVTNKLDQLNEIKEPSSECIKLFDNEPNKNIIIIDIFFISISSRIAIQYRGLLCRGMVDKYSI